MVSLVHPGNPVILGQHRMSVRGTQFTTPADGNIVKLGHKRMVNTYAVVSRPEDTFSQGLARGVPLSVQARSRWRLWKDGVLGKGRGYQWDGPRFTAAFE